MKFDFFLKNCSKIEKIKVNASKAHQEFTPAGRGTFSQNHKTHNTKEAAVMAIISPVEGVTHLTFIIRSIYDGAHSGQIAFAGGKREQNDTTILETAYREVEEEIGVKKNNLIFLRELTSVYVPVSDFRVYPFLAYAEETLTYIPQQSEVDKVVTLPLEDLFLETNIKRISVNSSNHNKIKAPAFVLDNYKIWGATSMILNEVKQIIVKTMQ